MIIFNIFNLDGITMDDFKKAMLLRAVPGSLSMSVNLELSAEEIARNLDSHFTVDGKRIKFA